MKTIVIILNWNGEDYLRPCIDSLLAQTPTTTVLVVDNDSHDTSRAIIQSYGDKIIALYNKSNLGFAGGVNTGIRYALENGYDAVGLLNNDAVAAKDWLRHLVSALKNDVGIVTGSLHSIDKLRIDSTGEAMSTWGLPYARGRGQPAAEWTDVPAGFVFGATGGASLYSAAMLHQIGLFDEDFFMYFEDVDISFRAQLAGWKVMVNPHAVAYHRIGASSSKVSGLVTYHSIKNWPILIIKNVPGDLMSIVLPRFLLAYALFIGSAIVVHRQPLKTLQAIFKFFCLLPKKLHSRRQIQSRKKVSSKYILSIMTPDLPENATRLRKLRLWWWKLSGRKK